MCECQKLNGTKQATERKLIMEDVQTVKITRVPYRGDKVLCDNVTHYLFTPTTTLWVDMGNCNGVICKDAEEAKVSGDNAELPEPFLVEMKFRILRPENTVFIQIDGSELNYETDWSMPPSTPSTHVAIPKGEFADLEWKSDIYRFFSPRGYDVVYIPLSRVKEEEDHLSAKYVVPSKMIQSLYLNGTSFESLEPILKWVTRRYVALLTRNLTREALSDFLKSPFNHEKERELALPTNTPEGLQDWDRLPAAELLRKLMEPELSITD